VFGIIIPTVGGVVVLALWVWALLDCISTDSILVRNLPKVAWVLLVIFIPTVGAICWLLLGRPEHAGISLGGRRSWLHEDQPWEPRPRRVSAAGPEDDPNWKARTTRSAPEGQGDTESLAVRERLLLEHEAELAKREAALEERERADEP